jgi:hypothetical protein
MAAGPWILLNDAKLALEKGLLILNADTFKVGLATSGSNLAAALTPSAYSNITDELSTANGYTAGGATASSPTLTGGGATATITWSTAAVDWVASGSGIVARFAYIYDNTAAVKQVIAYCLLDATPADVTTASGVTLTLTVGNVFTAT